MALSNRWWQQDGDLNWLRIATLLPRSLKLTRTSPSSLSWKWKLLFNLRLVSISLICNQPFFGLGQDCFKWISLFNMLLSYTFICHSWIMSMTINDMLLLHLHLMIISMILIMVTSRGLVADVWGGMQEMRRLVGNTMFLPLIVRFNILSEINEIWSNISSIKSLFGTPCFCLSLSGSTFYLK